MVALQVFVSSNDHHAMTQKTKKQTNKQTQG
jgi:hypothetical protein